MKKLFLFLALLFIPGVSLAQSNPVVGNGANINGTSPTLSGLNVNSSATAGTIKLGGTTASCAFNYGITSVSTLTFPCATTISGLTTFTGGVTVTSNIGGSGFAFTTGSSTYGATSAYVNGPVTASTFTGNGLVSTNGVGTVDDGASAHGLNFFMQNAATNGFSFYSGPTTSTNKIVQLTSSQNFLLTPNSNTTCLDLNAGFNGNCPVITNSTEGGLNFGAVAASAYGFRFFTMAGSTGTVEAQLYGGAFTLNPNGNGNCLQFEAGYTQSCPDITNSSDNGMNFFDSSASTLGYRWFSVASNGTLTGLLSLDNSGNLQVGSTVNIGTNGGNSQGATTPELNVNGDINVARASTNNGAIFFGSVNSQYLYYNGSNFIFSGGPVEATPNQGFELGTGTAMTEQSTTVAGISCGYFDFQIIGSTSLDCIDGSGNLGAAGAFYSASQRIKKNNITNYDGKEAVKIALNTQIVRFCYKTEKCKSGEERHIGFIADDTSTDIAPGHKEMDVNATAAVAIAAIKYQQTEINNLENDVKQLKQLVKGNKNKTGSMGLVTSPTHVIPVASADRIFIESIAVNVIGLFCCVFAWIVGRKFLKKNA